MSALSFPYCVGTPRAFINMASLYIYLCGDDTTRVFYIYGVVCVKFVNRQIKFKGDFCPVELSDKVLTWGDPSLSSSFALRWTLSFIT